MKIVVYKIETGDIVSTCSLPDGAEPPSQPTGYSWIEADVPFGSTDYYVLNGELALRPARPADYYIWTGEQWMPDIEMASADVKEQRDALLYESDWTELVGAETRLGIDLYNEWQNYRQQLRDITNQPGFPLNVIWPVKPV